MKNILEKIAKLIDVKSIMSLTLTIVFCYLTTKGILSTDFMTIFAVIVGFYFGTQSNKKNNDDIDNNKE